MMKKLLSPIFRKFRSTSQALIQKNVKTVYACDEFHALIELERDRVHRDDQQFSLIIIRVLGSDRNHDGINSLVHAITKRVRRIDQVGWYDTSHLGVLLPNTTQAGAQIIAKDISDAQDKLQKYRALETLSYPQSAK